MASPDTHPGPYDPPALADDDLWFLPGPSDDPDGDLPPLPRSDRRALIDPAVWQAAQADCALELAALSFRAGMLSERLRNAPAGWVQRLALIEAAELSWWVGDRLPQDRLSLWLGLRLSGVSEDALALQRAGWAVRRLTGGPGPQDGGWAQGLSAFLGRDAGELADLMDRASHLHPAVQAAILFQGWRIIGPGGPATDVEAAVLAARAGTALAPFLPLAFGGDALRATGPVPDRLRRWLTGTEAALRAALSQLDRLALWDRKARDALADLQGRTPPALVTVFTEWPHLTAPLAENATKASRASVQRNIDIMATRGLIREVTGQGRYRVWTARI